MSHSAGTSILLAIALLVAGCSSFAPPDISPTPFPESKKTKVVVLSPTPAEFPPEYGEDLMPGFLAWASSGDPVEGNDELDFIVFDTPSGACTIGVWRRLAPKLGKLVIERPNLFKDAKIMKMPQFIKVTPKEPLNSHFTLDDIPEVKSGPGIAYTNSAGTILISLGDLGPPKEFRAMGQASAQGPAIHSWEESGGESVIAAGPRKI